MLASKEGMETALAGVRNERYRQVRLKEQGRFTHTPDEVSLERGYLMLAEEFGEVSTAIQSVNGSVQEELTLKDVRKELIQVAAIAVAMVEGIDNNERTG